jgi:hypothetical protein
MGADASGATAVSIAGAAAGLGLTSFSDEQATSKDSMRHKHKIFFTGIPPLNES